MSLTLQILFGAVFFVGASALLCIMVGTAIFIVIQVLEELKNYKRNNPRGRK